MGWIPFESLAHSYQILMRPIDLQGGSTITQQLARNAYSPIKHPDRAKARRNLILKAMRKMGAITTEDYERATQAEMAITKLTADVTAMLPTLSISFMMNYQRITPKTN
jgi:membrane peptidoglycan carboxypeptidase